MTEGSRVQEHALKFARSLADPAFRQLLAAHGYSGGAQDVVVALDDTSIGEVLDKAFTRCRPPALVAIYRPSAEHQFVLVVVRPSAGYVEAGDREGPTGSLSEETSIGMLYDAMRHTNGMSFTMGQHRSYAVRRLEDVALA